MVRFLVSQQQQQTVIILETGRGLLIDLGMC